MTGTETSTEAARRRFRQRVREALRRADEAFRGAYAAEIEQLLGLSRAEIDEIAPGAGDLRTYDRLLAVVREASRANLAQADLRERIEALGELAVRIASRAPGLAALLQGGR